MDTLAGTTPPRYFGNEGQQRMQAAADSLWTLVQDDPRYAYAGRAVGINAPEAQDAPRVMALARIQGATLSGYVARDVLETFKAAAASDGLSTDQWDHFCGGAACIETCAAYARAFHLPGGYTVHRNGPETGDSDFDRMADTALACGVLPPAAAALQGLTRQGVCFWLEAPDGGAAACAGAVLGGHPESRMSRTAWWGMLATRPEDRGKSLSLYLGALAVLYLHETCGAEEFFTGIRSDNHVSRHLCAKLGVVPTSLACMAVLDPVFFGKDGLTK